MNTLKKNILKSMTKVVYMTACSEADSACAIFCYQPAMPKRVKNLEKRKE